jgi:hypothetical protein
VPTVDPQAFEIVEAVKKGVLIVHDYNNLKTAITDITRTHRGQGRTRKLTFFFTGWWPMYNMNLIVAGGPRSRGCPISLLLA